MSDWIKSEWMESDQPSSKCMSDEEVKRGEQEWYKTHGRELCEFGNQCVHCCPYCCTIFDYTDNGITVRTKFKPKGAVKLT